jgi:hypothetical protein
MYQQRPDRLAYQPPASSTFLSEHQQPVSSTFLSEQTSTSHRPPAIQLTDQLCLEAFVRPQTTGRGREPGPAAQTAPRELRHKPQRRSAASRTPSPTRQPSNKKSKTTTFSAFQNAAKYSLVPCLHHFLSDEPSSVNKILLNVTQTHTNGS